MDEKIIEKIIENEIYAPVNFADCEKTDWGILFFDEHNPACISANHAVITDPGTDLFKAAVQTRDFYLSKSLLPRIETPFCGLTGENQIKALERAGFFREYRHKAKQSEAERKAAGVFKSILKEAPGDEFSDHPDRFENRVVCMIKTNPAVQKKQGPLSVSRENYFGSELCKTLFGTDSEYIQTTVNRLCLSQKAHFFVGRLFGDGVSICTIEEGKELCRLTNVFTGMGFRHCGFAEKTVGFAAFEYEKNCSKPLYLLTENPRLTKLYQRAGFEITALLDKPFSAVWREQK